ncbi:MAG: hypothetical protein A2293_03580 [Elusimicrobia bacterium RIFOXYB2_FULL_49_7]|nr:MAG: hypothetical protein A2293_03580 [Elusimicrobia bacterium RIFOXYB2_FULL_49_7]
MTKRNAFFTALTIATFIMPLTATAESPEPVDLGSTAGFAVLAGSLISNIPASDITGDIGLSPSTGGNITGLSESEVTGTIFAVDAAGPAGSVAAATELTAAQSDLTIAYNNAAGRTPVPTDEFLNPGTGNIGGMTLVAGLYKFTGGLLISGSNLTLTGSATDVWIFQIASDLLVDNDIHIVLADEAQAANIFWQVGTSAVIGTGVIFKGTIMADQSISLNTGAVVEGRLLASIAAVTLASNTITLPEETTPIENGMASQAFAQVQNYPNPFNPSTLIQYRIENSAKVSLKIFNALGHEVATLVNCAQEAGNYSVLFNARNQKLNLSSGIYFCHLQTGSLVSINKLILIK